MVVLFGIASNLVPTEGVSVLCQTRLWLSVLAFTLAYGSILAQTFRVFYILRNNKVAHGKTDSRISGELIVSKYVAESITMIAGRFGHESLCQLRTEQIQGCRYTLHIKVHIKVYTMDVNITG